MNFCSFFFIDFGIDLTEFLRFEIFFCQVLEIKKFYLVVFEVGAKALEFLPGTCEQMFIV